LKQSQQPRKIVIIAETTMGAKQCSNHPEATDMARLGCRVKGASEGHCGGRIDQKYALLLGQVVVTGVVVAGASGEWARGALLFSKNCRGGRFLSNMRLCGMFTSTMEN
jgi:hypothetical protein